MERLPYLATAAAAPYESLGHLPVSVLLDNVRSLYNVGSFFRTADAAGIEKLLLGFHGNPDRRSSHGHRAYLLDGKPVPGYCNHIRPS